MSVRFAETPQSERSLQRTLSQGYGSGLRRWARQGFGLGVGWGDRRLQRRRRFRPPASPTRPTIPCVPCLLQPEEQELQPRRPGHLWCRARCEPACPRSPRGLPQSLQLPPSTHLAPWQPPRTNHPASPPHPAMLLPHWRRAMPWLLLQEHHDCSSRMQAAVDDAVVSAEREAHAAGDRNLM